MLEQVFYFSDAVSLHKHVAGVITNYSSVFILMDENTEKYCYPFLPLHKATPIVISSGENNKTLSSCEMIWTALTDGIADRNTVLINLGGGVISDMGGFAASCYKRGIDFINIPTTLLSMVDAAIGGKTGVDFHQFKNQIGVFSSAQAVLILPEFLKTLDKRQIRSGLAEVIKHYLIADTGAFYDIANNELAEIDNFLPLIQKALEIKSRIVQQDPQEKGPRKALNLGHTFGHAVESYFLGRDNSLLHGEAIAIGMAVESIIAREKGMLDMKELDTILNVLKNDFHLMLLPGEIEDALFDLMLQDKKNENSNIRMSLPEGIGRCKVDVKVTKEEIKKALSDYNACCI